MPGRCDLGRTQAWISLPETSWNYRAASQGTASTVPTKVPRDLHCLVPEPLFQDLRCRAHFACCLFSLCGLVKLKSRAKVDYIKNMGTGLCCATWVRQLLHSRHVHFSSCSLHSSSSTSAAVTCAQAFQLAAPVTCAWLWHN